MPVIVLLGLGAIEGANKIFVRQATVMATYEAAKAIAEFDGTTARAQTLCTQVLQSRGIDQHTLILEPANAEDLDPGALFTVRVQVPGNQRTVTGIGPFQNLLIEARATMAKE
jgi:hypothetical protein